MASVGLKDSFFHNSSINEAYQKNFMFGWLCKLHKFYAVPNGYYDSYLHIWKVYHLYLNYQVENYTSWFPELKASTIDAFSIDWPNEKTICISNIRENMQATVSLLESLGLPTIFEL